MSDQPETLAAVFGLDERAKGDRRPDPAALAELTARLSGLLRGDLPPRHLAAAAGETLAALRGALVRPLGTILTNAWNKRDDFRKFADEAKYPPGTVSRVTLCPHTAKWTYRPSVTILLDGRPVRKVSFVVELAVTLDGAQVAIERGRFVRIHAGRSRLSATLRCGDVVLAKRSSGEYELPAVLALGDGVPVTSIVAPFSMGAGPGPTVGAGGGGVGRT